MTVKSLITSEPSLFCETQPLCRSDVRCASCPVEPCVRSVLTHEAVRLIQAGARAPLVKQLTGLPEKYVKRLYKALRGRASPKGMAPYSDAWFLDNEGRMLHATVVWQLYQQLLPTQRSEARRLLDVQALYNYQVQESLLDFTRIATALQLMTTKIWHEKNCQHCQLMFVGPSDDSTRLTCPSCKLYYRYRCMHCAAPLSDYTQGRPRSVCKSCRNSNHVDQTQR